MAKTQFSFDPLTRVRTDFEALEGGGFALHYTHDAEPVIEANKIKQGYGREYYASGNRKGEPEMWKVAAIPPGVQLKWLTEHGVDVLNDDHLPKVKQLLNDPEYRWLKTANVTI